ncbi:unnamed protein product [marine sediment metagenome]|uniref:Uncharacterized protein n=1 Tax=marine sediment metagenome TaxID=412755 RepID=X1FZ85_9ZZZZ
MSQIDDLAESKLEEAKLPTIFSYRQAFILGYQTGYNAHKTKVFAILYGRKPDDKDDIIRGVKPGQGGL